VSHKYSDSESRNFILSALKKPSVKLLDIYRTARTHGDDKFDTFDKLKNFLTTVALPREADRVDNIEIVTSKMRPLQKESPTIVKIIIVQSGIDRVMIPEGLHRNLVGEMIVILTPAIEVVTSNSIVLNLATRTPIRPAFALNAASHLTLSKKQQIMRATTALPQSPAPSQIVKAPTPARQCITTCG